METKEIILELRRKHSLSQDELAEKLFVTRQAVSRWENGETMPNIETLKALSKLFDVSINTLLGSPRTLICQCCGMPLDDDSLSREPDGSFNEDYCKWCYADGEFVYKTLDELLDFLSEHLANEHRSPAELRAALGDQLPRLRHWRRLSLREFTCGDAAVIRARQYPSLDEQQVVEMIDEWSTKQHDGNYFEMFAVVDDDEIVGSVSLYSRHEGIASHGVEIYPEYRRLGYGAAAVTLMLEHAKALGFKVVTAQVRKDNDASVALHRKLGFALDHEYVNGRRNEVYFYIKVLD